MRVWGWVVVVILAGSGPGCSRAADQSLPQPAESEVSGLATTLEVEVAGDLVRLALHATNSTTEPIRLEFPSAQRYDFMIRTTAGEVVWSWSADKSFAQMLGAETVPPGGTLRYRAEWNSGGRKGSFEAVGWLTAFGKRLEQRTRFEL